MNNGGKSISVTPSCLEVEIFIQLILMRLGTESQKPFSIVLQDQNLIKSTPELFILNAWYRKNLFCL